ncbi:MAG: hypothetical protein A2887_00160 [Alphaproteobacteria bacterium RIFCSPLOWO2_01_FULL_40_26]|nr:MAG: hypothetical protein A2887_00160 [Alphaproteobacteria bacterium RIFCSPLOWO2_01_FULL_40_26]OFX10073.1 MAG: hypothetical protein A3H30_04620 [Alphaproteobacteria bacterium RIFCSPLOWO2_02_FULL_40_19]
MQTGRFIIFRSAAIIAQGKSVGRHYVWKSLIWIGREELKTAYESWHKEAALCKKHFLACQVKTKNF